MENICEKEISLKENWEMWKQIRKKVCSKKKIVKKR